MIAAACRVEPPGDAPPALAESSSCRSQRGFGCAFGTPINPITRQHTSSWSRVNLELSSIPTYAICSAPRVGSSGKSRVRGIQLKEGDGDLYSRFRPTARGPAGCQARDAADERGVVRAASGAERDARVVSRRPVGGPQARRRDKARGFAH